MADILALSLSGFWSFVGTILLIQATSKAVALIILAARRKPETISRNPV